MYLNVNFLCFDLATFLRGNSMIINKHFLLVEETGENRRPAASHGQALSHNVVSSTPRHERGSNSQR
jgi:hypothetical protein